MKWPWVSRKAYDELMATAIAAFNQERALRVEAEQMYEREREWRREEVWRRLRAEGVVQFQADRIRRVLGLPGFAENDNEKDSA